MQIDPLTRRTRRKYIRQHIYAAIVVISALSFVIGSYGLSVWVGDQIEKAKPWALVTYRFMLKMDDPYPLAWMIAAVAPPIGLTAIGGGLYIATPKPQTHKGSARWASKWDRINAGLHNDRGLILAKHGIKILRANLNTHVLVVAPTRSGKGIGIVVPNMLTWHGSVLCTDIKFELWELTSGFRATFSDCYMLAFGRLNSGCYNPLDMIRRDPIFRVGDIQTIAHMIRPDPYSGDPMWSAEARAMFSAVVLYLMDTPDCIVSLSAVYHFINGTDWSKDAMEEMLAKRPDLDNFTRDTFARFSKQSEKQRSGVTATILSALEIYSDPVIAAATNTSSFDVREIRNKRTSIYLGIAPGQTKRLSSLLNLVTQQISQFLVDDIKAAGRGLPVLLAIDEAPALGPLPAITESLGFFAGYNVRVLWIAQNTHQIRRVYKDSYKEILAGFRHVVYYAPNSKEEAQDISDALGHATVEVKTRSHSGGKTSVSTVYNGKPLMDTSEIRRMSQKDAILIQEYQYPVKARKFNYLKVRNLKRRTKISELSIKQLEIEQDSLRTLWGEPLDEPEDDFATIAEAA